MKQGLVMEGGGMRGIFSVGVTDVLMEENIFFDGIIGVSAGAALGCNIKSRQPGRAIRYNLKYCSDPRFCSYRSLFKTGDLFSTDFCYREVPINRDPFDFKTFHSTPEEFYAVCTDVHTGEAVYHLCDDQNNDIMLDWIRASASMPIVSHVVSVGGYDLLDGGIADSIPLRFFESRGYEKNLVILTQPEGYKKERNKALPLLKIKERKHPELLKKMEERHIIYNKSIFYAEQQQKYGKALLIRPLADLPSGRVEHDRARMKGTYEAGRAVAKARLKEIKDFLESR